jgi:hypothetical protein
MAWLGACGDDQQVETRDDGPLLQPFGTYQIATRAQFPLEAAIPGAAGDAFALLRSLKSDPAGVLVAAAGGAGVPAVEAVYGAVPDLLKGKLNGWINASLRKKDASGGSLDSRIDLILAIGETVLTDFGLDTTMVVSTEGPTGATHSLNAVRFFPPAPLSVVSIPRIEPPGPLLPPGVPLSVSLGMRTQQSVDLVFGPHSFRLPFGDYAWLGFNGALHASSGSDLAGLMVLALDCAAMASEVAGQCVGPVCVGHKSGLQSLCEAGRAKIIAEAESKVRSAGFTAMEIVKGTAKVMTGTSGKVLNNGVWSMKVNNGSDLRDVPAQFSGTALNM